MNLKEYCTSENICMFFSKSHIQYMSENGKIRVNKENNAAVVEFLVRLEN
jgi:hypothetical protein